MLHKNKRKPKTEHILKKKFFLYSRVLMTNKKSLCCSALLFLVSNQVQCSRYGLLRSSCIKVSASYVISVSKNTTILKDNITRASISLVLSCLQKTEGQAYILDSFAIITRKIQLHQLSNYMVFSSYCKYVCVCGNSASI